MLKCVPVPISRNEHNKERSPFFLVTITKDWMKNIAYYKRIFRKLRNSMIYSNPNIIN